MKKPTTLTERMDKLERRLRKLEKIITSQDQRMDELEAEIKRIDLNEIDELGGTDGK